MTLDREVVELVGHDPELLAIADAVASVRPTERRRGRRLRRASLVALPLMTAAALTPIGGASLVSRASGDLGFGSEPPAPAPYQRGDQVWTHDAPVGAPSAAATATGSPKSNPSAPSPYSPGAQVWTTTPDITPKVETIPCQDLATAASALEALEQEGSSTTAVECR